MSAPEDKPTAARARLLSHFSAATSISQHGQKWDDLWKQDFTPWDQGTPNPALVDLLTERHQDLPPTSENQKRKKALVPGCGKGYDVLLLAAFGYDAYGLEVSSTALEACRKVEKEYAGKGIYETKVDGGSVTWLSGDFFADGFLGDVKGDRKFDLIYDYTFLSALPPSLRPAWSKRFGELLAPEGIAICIEYPTYKPASTGGPPWALPPKIYLAHLPRPGVELAYSEESGELDESSIGEPGEHGLVRLEHFQPKRSHQISYSAEGKVTDWISIWAHPSS